MSYDEDTMDSLEYALEGPDRQRSLSLFMRWRFELAMNDDGQDGDYKSGLIARMRERQFACFSPFSDLEASPD